MVAVIRLNMGLKAELRDGALKIMWLYKAVVGASKENRIRVKSGYSMRLVWAV